MGRFVKIILGGIGLLYLWCLYVYVSTPIRTDIVKSGKLEDYENTVAYVIRKEDLLYSNVAGSFNGIAKEGEKVAKGAKVATVYKNNIDQKIQDIVKDIDERIVKIKNSQVQNDIFAGDIAKLEDRIDNKVNDIIDVTYVKSGTKLSQLKTDINSILDKKLIISGEKGASGYNLDELQKEKEKYESQLKSSKLDLIAENAGIVSYTIDQMEQFLNPVNIKEFTPSGFTALDNMEFDNNAATKPGQAVAKIIDNFEWYLGFVIEDQKIYDLKEGDRVQVRFNDSDYATVGAAVYYISREESGKKVVVLALNRHIDSIYRHRKVDVDIIQHTYSGLKIPTSAIRVQGGKVGVYVLRKRIAKFCEVDVLYKTGDFAIVKENNLNERGLLLYDEIVVKSNDIQEGTLVQ
ncbi:MAG: hypothetical protein MJB12_02800 [Firmicutes bacterium]|nr:hypothetical protein [Bacillota bacterium]